VLAAECDCYSPCVDDREDFLRPFPPILILIRTPKNHTHRSRPYPVSWIRFPPLEFATEIHFFSTGFSGSSPANSHMLVGPRLRRSLSLLPRSSLSSHFGEEPPLPCGRSVSPFFVNLRHSPRQRILPALVSEERPLLLFPWSYA